MSETCFAYKLNMKGQLECSALNEGTICNGCNKECRFYKTMAQVMHENATRKPCNIDTFFLFVDGKKVGEFGSIEDMDNYLRLKVYEEDKQWEDARAKRYGNVFAGEWQAVFFNHSIHFGYRRD